MGSSIYQNAGMLVIIVIIVGLWKTGRKLEEAITMSLLAMVFYLFTTINFMFYMGMTTLQGYMAVLDRVSQIFQMAEYHSDRQIQNVNGREVVVKM